MSNSDKTNKRKPYIQSRVYISFYFLSPRVASIQHIHSTCIRKLKKNAQVDINNQTIAAYKYVLYKYFTVEYGVKFNDSSMLT
jgi:hypothetical protein